MAAHAQLAPSSAPIWGYCSGSVAAANARPSAETEQTRNGTAAHWVAAVCLNNWRRGGVPDPRGMVGEVCPENGVVIDDAMAEGAAVYVSDVVDTLGPIPGGREALVVEFRVHMPRVHRENWGTLDAAAVLPGIVYLWDYKHGHAKVEAPGNLQLIDYLEGLREMLSVPDHARIVARVVQPFAYNPRGPISEWRGVMCDIHDSVLMLNARAREVYDRPTLTSGPHCKYCPARGVCSALRGAAYNVIDVVNGPLEFDRMGGADLRVERDILARGAEMLKARLDAIEDELTHRVKSGDGSTGLSLAAVPGRLKWSVDPEQAIAALAVLGVDIRKSHCDTPSQARQRLPPEMRNGFDSAVKRITKRDSTLKLVNSTETISARTFSNGKPTP